MKRAKRDVPERAYKLGYNQGHKGHQKEQCPFLEDIEKRAAWMQGWRMGHAEYVAGYRFGMPLQAEQAGY